MLKGQTNTFWAENVFNRKKLNNPFSNNQRKVKIDDFVLSYLNMFLEKGRPVMNCNCFDAHCYHKGDSDSGKPSKYLLYASTY